VHRARVRDGDGDGERDVAVKILRPGVQARFARDLGDMYAAAHFAARYFRDADRLRPVEVVETLERSVRMEMDFRLEAAAASEFAENVVDDPEFRIPSIDWDRTAKDVLTLEWIDGIPLTDLASLERAGHDLPRLGRIVIQSFLNHALRDGFFHADMHQGNLFLDATGRLVAVDFGITGRLGPKERRFLAEILYGFITRNYRRVAEVHFEAGYVPETFSIDDFAQAVRAIGEPIHSRTADQISMAKLLTLLFEITAIFEMKTRTELVMLQKTMVVVEGVGRTLDPRLDLWSTAEPIVRSWIEQNLGPRGKIEDFGRNLSTLARFANELPNVLLRGERLVERCERMASDGFELSGRTVERIGRAEAQRARSGHFALWVIAALLAIGLWLR
jgi:ubiquinone biosynthesis protein